MDIGIRADVMDRLESVTRQLNSARIRSAESIKAGHGVGGAYLEALAGLEVTVRLWTNVDTAMARNSRREEGPFPALKVLKACLASIDERLVEYTQRSSTSALSNLLDAIEQEARVDFRKELARMIARASR